jgi:hypothetical protein
VSKIRCKSRLPIAGDGGNSLFVDLLPGPAHGCVRQFLRDDGAGDAAWWGGVAAILAEVVAARTHEVPVHGNCAQLTWL